MTNLRTFGRKMRVLASQIEENTSDLVKKVAIRVHHNVVMGTPVDEGDARSNWQVTLNQPASGTIPSRVPGHLGSTRGQVAAETLVQGLRDLDLKRPGDSVFITNNLDYIQALNKGHSPQAKTGYVQDAVNAGITVVRGNKITVTSK